LKRKGGCGIKLEWCLENEAVEKASVKGDVPKVAMDLQEGASVYDYGMPAMCCNWTIKATHLCLHFGALFVDSMRLEYAGPKTSPGHGPIVQATILQAMLMSLTMPTVSHTKRLSCTCVLSHVTVYTVR